MHFRDALEHLHPSDMRFVLHTQLIGCMHTTGITSKHFQTSSSQSVPFCQKSIVSVGLFSRSLIEAISWLHSLPLRYVNLMHHGLEATHLGHVSLSQKAMPGITNTSDTLFSNLIQRPYKCPSIMNVIIPY